MPLISAILSQNGTDEPYSGGRIKYALPYFVPALKKSTVLPQFPPFWLRPSKLSSVYR